MTAKRDKPKNIITEEMAADVVLEPPIEEDMAAEEGQVDKPPRRPDEPKDSENSKSLLERIEQFTRMFASVGVGTAAILGFNQYYEANQDLKRERSLEFVRDWQQDKVIDRYTNIQTFVEGKLLETDPLPPDLTNEAAEMILTNLGYNWTSELRATDTPGARKIENDIDRLVLFFSQMTICIEADLCNSAVLEAYFGSEVVSFWQYFSGYAQVRQEANYSGYGSQVNELVGLFKSLNPE